MTARTVVLAIFILSGAAGLMYEVVWARQLVLVFGNTTQAVSTILTGFFGGMALGSWLGGRAADRVRRPLRMYGLLEVLLVAVVLLTPVSFRLIGEAYRGAFPRLEATPNALALVRFGLSLLALGPATVLMGATLPTLTRHLAREARHLSASFTRLYAANTIGAILGAAASGLVLIELLGLSGTLLAGATCSGVAGLAALALDRRTTGPAATSKLPTPTTTEAEHPAEPARLRLALAVAFLSGLTSLGYQVLWNRLIAAGTGNSTYVFTVILVVFLVGLAIGAVVFARLRPRIRSVTDLLAFGQVSIALLVLAGSALVIDRHLVPPLNPATSLDALFGPFVIATILVVLPATVVMGLTFPAASALLGGTDRQIAGRAGLLLAVNTIGAVCGTFLVPFVAIPLIGSPAVTAGLALVNALAAIALALASRRRRALTPALGVATALVIAAGAATGRIFVDPTAAQVRASAGSVYGSAEDEIAPVVAGEVGGFRQLWVAGTSMTALTVDAKLMPILPLMLRPAAQTDLTIAFGMGSAFRAGLVAGLRVDGVELVPSVPKMFGFYYADAATVRANPNGRVIVADGRNHVELTDRRYDIVVVDPPPPIESAGVSVISSREFYAAAHARFTPGGVMMQWIPYGQTIDEFRAHVRTFHDVFRHVIVAFGPGGNGLYMLGSDEPLGFTDETIRAVLARPGVAQDLSSAFDSPVHTADAWARLIPTLVWIDGPAVEAFAGSGPLITDDHPLPEYFLLRHLLGPASPPVTRQALLALAGR